MADKIITTSRFVERVQSRLVLRFAGEADAISIIIRILRPTGDLRLKIDAGIGKTNSVDSEAKRLQRVIR